jgi:hypothetical protein
MQQRPHLSTVASCTFTQLTPQSRHGCTSCCALPVSRVTQLPWATARCPHPRHHQPLSVGSRASDALYCSSQHAAAAASTRQGLSPMVSVQFRPVVPVQQTSVHAQRMHSCLTPAEDPQPCFFATPCHPTTAATTKHPRPASTPHPTPPHPSSSPPSDWLLLCTAPAHSSKSAS